MRPYKQPLQVSATQANIQSREPMLNVDDTPSLYATPAVNASWVARFDR
jgi:hypothetical protein